MRVNNFGSIGKAVIIRALGLQENHTEITDKLDEQSTGCFSCAHYLEKQIHRNNTNSCQYKAAEIACNSCSKKVYLSKRLNEKNRYGEARPIKVNAIKLFCFLHLCSPTSTGVVVDFHISSAAKELKCCEKTVLNNLRKLQNQHYITFYPSITRGAYIVTLLDYTDYFKSADKGGRGFFVLSKNLFSSLVKVSYLNEMRIYLREYINIDARKKYGSLHENPVRRDTRTLTELRRYLPSYMKPCNIRSLLSKESSMFVIEGDTNITFTLKANLFGEDDKKAMQVEYNDRLIEHIDSVNHILEERSNKWIPEEEIPDYLHPLVEQIISNHRPLLIEVDRKDIDDFVQMSLQYSYEAVLNALHDVWATGNIEKMQSKYGAVVRNILKKD